MVLGRYLAFLQYYTHVTAQMVAPRFPFRSRVDMMPAREPHPSLTLRCSKCGEPLSIAADGFFRSRASSRAHTRQSGCPKKMWLSACHVDIGIAPTARVGMQAAAGATGHGSRAAAAATYARVVTCEKAEGVCG